MYNRKCIIIEPAVGGWIVRVEDRNRDHHEQHVFTSAEQMAAFVKQKAEENK